MVKKHWFTLAAPTIFTILTCGFASLWLIYAYLRYSKDQIFITNKKFSIKSGLISITSVSTPLDKIHNFQYRQDFTGRIFGYRPFFYNQQQPMV